MSTDIDKQDERFLDKLKDGAENFKEKASRAPDAAGEKVEDWKDKAEDAPDDLHGNGGAMKDPVRNTDVEMKNDQDTAINSMASNAGDAKEKDLQDRATRNANNKEDLDKI